MTGNGLRGLVDRVSGDGDLASHLARSLPGSDVDSNL